MKIRQSQLNPVYREPSAGDLNQRIAIRSVSEVPSDNFGTRKVYGEPNSVWGKITSVSDLLFSSSMQTESKITHRCVVRWTRIPEDVAEVHHDIGGVVMKYRIKGWQPLNGARRFIVISLELLNGHRTL